MEFSSNTLNYNRKTNRFKSVSNVFTNKLSQIERSNSNINSSTSKKTAGFEESLNFLTGKHKKMNSFSIEKDSNKLRFSCNNNLPIHQSQELSMKDIKAKGDANNGNYTNINISIVNPNFSINNIENSNRGTNITNKRLNFNIINNTLVSFKESNNIEVEESSKKDNKTKMIASIYKDYLENKSNEETFSENFKDETKKNMFKEYLKKKKIIKYENNTNGIISGFAAYMYPNEEIINKDKICLNINIKKLSINGENDNKKEINYNSHLINFFSLFYGGEKDDNDELPKFLKNNLKDIILNDNEIINDPQNAIKNSLMKCEIDYIKNYKDEEKKIKQKNLEKNIIENNRKIPNCSIYILLNIDDIFYIANIGNSISIISSNYSKKINYLTNEINTQEVYENNYDDKRKSINSLFNCINCINDDMSNIKNDNNNEKTEIDNSQVLFNASNISIINTNNNHYYINNVNQNIVTSVFFLRTFPGKPLYDMFPKNINNFNTNNNTNNNNNINKNSTSKRNSKVNANRRLSTTFGAFSNLNFNNKNIKLNNFVKDFKNQKYNKNIKTNKDNNYNISKNFFDDIQNIKKVRASFMSQNTYDNFFPEKKIISSYPDIVSFKYQQNYNDFILIGCKKIFEKLSYEKICKGIYETMKRCIRKHRSFEMFLGCVVKDIIKKCISLGITSNISCLFICFEPIKKLYLEQDINLVKNVLVSFYLPLPNKNKFEYYEDFLTTDFIDIDKANNYNNMLMKEVEKINKIRKNFSTNIINKEELKAQFYDKVDEKNEDKNKFKKVKNNIKIMKKKCCECLIY